MKNIYQEITDKVIAMLKEGVIPWHKPWKVEGGEFGQVSHSTGKGYSLLNSMLLMEDGEFATFNQIKAEGGHVKKGAHSRPIYFWKMLESVDEETREKKQIPCLKYYNVFNILTDVEGIEPKYFKKPEPQKKKVNPIKKAEKVASEYIKKFSIHFQNELMDRAFFRPSEDLVQVPPINTFDKKEEYYSTLYHELTHSTGHESRINRLKKDKFGSWHYAKEELVAEIGAAASLTKLGIDTKASLKNSAAYIQSWIKKLNDDPKMIVSAAGKAEKAVQMIFNETKEQANA